MLFSGNLCINERKGFYLNSAEDDTRMSIRLIKPQRHYNLCLCDHFLSRHSYMRLWRLVSLTTIDDALRLMSLRPSSSAKTWTEYGVCYDAMYSVQYIPTVAGHSAEQDGPFSGSQFQIWAALNAYPIWFSR